MTTATDVFKVAGAIIASVGGAGVILLALAGWLGTVGAARILEEDRAKYQSELERLEGEFEARNRALQGLHHAHVLKCGPRSWRTKLLSNLPPGESVR